MATDRMILRLQQKGALVTTDVVSAENAVRDMHTSTVQCMRISSDNADTNVTGVPLLRVPFACKPTIYFTPVGTTAGNATHYTLLTVEATRAGTGIGIVASWNTHTSAQSGFTGNVPFLLVANTDMVLAAGDNLHTTKRTVGNGGQIGQGPFSIYLEEV